MIEKIHEEVHRFWAEKGIEPNALILGAEIVERLMVNNTMPLRAGIEKLSVCGYGVAYVDYMDPERIRAILM